MFLNCGVGKTLESLLDCKKIKLVNPKGNQSWIVTGRTVVEAEAPILWPPDAKNWLIGKDPNSGKDWRWEEKGMTEDEMVVWHHWFMDTSLSKLWELVMDKEAWHAAAMGFQIVRHDWSSELNWLVSSLHQVAKVLELQLQQQSFQWLFRTGFL